MEYIVWMLKKKFDNKLPNEEDINEYTSTFIKYCIIDKINNFPIDNKLIDKIKNEMSNNQNIIDVLSNFLCYDKIELELTWQINKLLHLYIEKKYDNPKNIKNILSFIERWNQEFKTVLEIKSINLAKIKKENNKKITVKKKISNSIIKDNNVTKEKEDVTKEKEDVTKEDITKEDITKEDIIKLFKKNIKGKVFKKNISTGNDGAEGHWLEKLMNLKLNSSNTPDLGGYEMKKDSKKISFGDWSAEYLFSQKKNLLEKINKEDINLSKEEFIKNFGNKTKDKKNRYSWSGSCIPKYGKWNDCGQILKIDNDKNIMAIYSYDKDKRNLKDNEKWKGKEICIAIWSSEKMKNHVNSKFNQKGFFICKKDKNMVYDKICFGPPITYDIFIEKVKSGDIFFDSGMYYDIDKPNNRLYSQWRANHTFWDNLISEEF